MGTGLGGTKWAKIHARANNKLWHQAGGAPNGLKFTRAQTINYMGAGLVGTKWAKMRMHFSQFVAKSLANLCTHNA